MGTFLLMLISLAKKVRLVIYILMNNQANFNELAKILMTVNKWLNF